MSENRIEEDNAVFLDADYDDEEPAEEKETDLQAEQEAIDEQLRAAAEGLLFLTGDEGITAGMLAEVLEISEEKAENLLEGLQVYYLNDARGIEIARYGRTYKFLSKAFVHPYAKKLFQLGKTSVLSQAALETLAIIAYKQPITRAEIEEIRGVGAEMMLRKLLARNLIKEDGRSEAPGRPILYAVTEEFMDAFQMLSLEELPELPDFAGDGEGSDELF
ncbi:MAG: SMC-Scp complex subunit ScpB [Solobacterium sp.]|nr:SMC-Scp complex subunit ScpB [Solobacterium sp.]